jgi:hypothetical protein
MNHFILFYFRILLSPVDTCRYTVDAPAAGDGNAEKRAPEIHGYDLPVRKAAQSILLGYKAGPVAPKGSRSYVLRPTREGVSNSYPRRSTARRHGRPR